MPAWLVVEMNLLRIFSMGPAEWLFRGRQQAYKVASMLAPAAAVEPDMATRATFDRRGCDRELLRLLRHQETHGDQFSAAGLMQHLQHLLDTRFFCAVDHQLVQACATADGTSTAKILATADAVCRGEFDILGYGRLSFGDPVNWQLDPVSGRESPAIHWSRIDPLAYERVGDSKVVWELNRHQWLLDLGQAYLLSGDERYAQRFVSLLSQWMARNPPGVGINWSSALEAAIRLIAWCWALRLFRQSRSLTPGFFLVMLGWLQHHGQFVARNLSQYFSPNTHLTVEALSLFYLGVLLPELRGARQWRSLGRRILLAELDKQVLADGVYFEQSTRYQYYTADIYLQFLALAEKNSELLPARLRAGIDKMLVFLLYVQRPDGSLPQIGDADGGWLLPLRRRPPEDYQSVFSTAAVLLGNKHYAWAARALAPETLWLLGRSAQSRWSSLRPVPPPGAPARYFAEGGYIVLRKGWARDDHQLIFTVGPRNPDTCSGHDHADLLSVQCSAWGENYLVDAGTYCYTADATWRNYFRSSYAHSTVVIDRRGQSEPAGPFAWRRRPQARRRKLVSMPAGLLAEAQYDASRVRGAVVSHRRRVLFIDSEYWLVVDELSGEGTHSADIRYQFSPIPVALDDSGWVRARGERSELLIKAFSSSALETGIFCGELAPPGGWLSPNYGQRLAAPMLSVATVAELPLRVVTLLLPRRGRATPCPSVSAQIEQGRLTALVFAAPQARVIRL